MLPTNVPLGKHPVNGTRGNQHFSFSITVRPGGPIAGGTGLDSDRGPLAIVGLGSLATAAAGSFWLLRRPPRLAPRHPLAGG